jgi:hypothetical protein
MRGGLSIGIYMLYERMTEYRYLHVV